MKKTITTALLFTALAITAQTPDMKLAGNELLKRLVETQQDLIDSLKKQVK